MDEGIPEPIEDEGSPAPAIELEKLVRNDKTKRVHLVTAEGALSCTRVWPVNYTMLDDLPADARLCRECF